MSSTVEGRRIPATLLATLRDRMAGPTIEDIDALVGPATPHFAFQIRARVREAIQGLPEDDPVRRYGEEKIALLERLGFASTKAEHSEHESRERIGWETIPSAAPAGAGEPVVPPRAPSPRGATPR
jgi:hypothetical protein